MSNRISVSIPDDLWVKLVDVQAFKQKQVLQSVSMSDIIIKILADTVDHGPYYQAILIGKRILETEKAPTIRKEGTTRNGRTVALLKSIEQI